MSDNIIRPGEYDYFETLQIIKQQGEISNFVDHLKDFASDKLRWYSSNPRRLELLQNEVQRLDHDPDLVDDVVLPYIPRRLIHLKQSDGYLKLRTFIQYMNRPFKEYEHINNPLGLPKKTTSEMNRIELKAFVLDEITELIKNACVSPRIEEVNEYLPPLKIDLERKCIGFLYHRTST